MPATTRTWRPGRPVALHETLGSLRRGSGDPAYRVASGGAVWRTSLTPDGPGTLRVEVRAASGTVEATAWGLGADWLLDGLPEMLGQRDDPAPLPGMPLLLRDTLRRYPGWRVPRTRRVLEALVPAVLEQKVTGTDARRSWRRLLRRFGTPAPGPAPEGMWVAPGPETWARIPSWEWHRAGVDSGRWRTVAAAARVAGRLEQAVDLAPDEARRRLRAVPGVGVWTAAEVAQRALGDVDAVSVGDLHLPGLVGRALSGAAVDDDGMLALLEPYRPQRYRVVRMVELSGIRAPRFAPRYAPRDIRGL